MKKMIVITGVNGGIGSAIATHFLDKGYAVLGLDLQPTAKIKLDAFISVNLADVVGSCELRAHLGQQINDFVTEKNVVLSALVNNAAVQILDGVDTVTMDDFLMTQTINVAAPLMLSQLCLPKMQAGEAVIVNIGSIHATLTKPGFISYATSKAAIKGLTQAMAVDLAGRATVNCIEPAAVATEMLVDGFRAAPEKLKDLGDCHPSGRIGTPDEVAELCYFLIDTNVKFLNGASIGLNGAIAARLHDVV
ncbi:MAG: SDR family oxidoreductase [Oceanicoccus sp.]